MDQLITTERNAIVLRPIDLAALVLTIVGAINWALVGLFSFDLVATITGSEFGETNVVSSLIYVAVGIAGLWLLTVLVRGWEARRSAE